MKNIQKIMAKFIEIELLQMELMDRLNEEVDKRGDNTGEPVIIAAFFMECYDKISATAEITEQTEIYETYIFAVYKYFNL